LLGYGESDGVGIVSYGEPDELPRIPRVKFDPNLVAPSLLHGHSQVFILFFFLFIFFIFLFIFSMGYASFYYLFQFFFLVFLIAVSYF
jgi:hypothetical protein